MFQLWGTIFMVGAVIVFFVAWSRSIKLKDMIKRAREEWSLFRTLVLAAIIAQLILVIVALVGLRVTFSYLSALFIAYFSVVYYFSVQFMLAALGGGEGAKEKSDEKIFKEMRDCLTIISSSGEGLEKGDKPSDVRESAASIVSNSKRLSSLLDRFG